MIVRELYDRVSKYRTTTAWARGVQEYALEMLSEYMDEYGCYHHATDERLREGCLRGAEDWTEYSTSGFKLIVAEEIASRLCTHDELIRYDHGRKEPRGHDWMQIQAIALRQAFNMILNASHTAPIDTHIHGRVEV